MHEKSLQYINISKLNQNATLQMDFDPTYQLRYVVCDPKEMFPPTASRFPKRHGATRWPQGH